MIEEPLIALLVEYFADVSSEGVGQVTRNFVVERIYVVERFAKENCCYSNVKPVSYHTVRIFDGCKKFAEGWRRSTDVIIRIR